LEVALFDVQDYIDFPRSKFTALDTSRQQFTDEEIELSQHCVAARKLGYPHRFIRESRDVVRGCAVGYVLPLRQRWNGPEAVGQPQPPSQNQIEDRHAHDTPHSPQLSANVPNKAGSSGHRDFAFSESLTTRCQDPESLPGFNPRPVDSRKLWIGPHPNTATPWRLALFSFDHRKTRNQGLLVREPAGNESRALGRGTDGGQDGGMPVAQARACGAV
jgi:hypothetical protein